MFKQIKDKKFHLWLPGYFINRVLHSYRTLFRGDEIHVVFLVVDHFEPSRRQGQLGIEKVRQWCNKYENVARQHTDSDNVYPQHCWFYRYDYPSYDCIDILNESVFNGFGEIEFHLHHSYDTPETFSQKIREGVRWFSRAGAMISSESNPRTRFAYIAGNWSLDNGRRDPRFGGVNNELEILAKYGCYADFTFPAIGTSAQPQRVNSIYYAKDTKEPKSYRRGKAVSKGGSESGDIMIFQGPVYINWKSKYIESAAFESFAPYNSRRITSWISAGVHVIGRPEWIFVKLHTHGIQSMDFILGEPLDLMLSELEMRYKEPPYSLHYVTAREAYNIVKAAEAGCDGNPGDYRDYEIPRPANRRILCNQLFKLIKFSQDELILAIEDSAFGTEIKFNDLPIDCIKGQRIRQLKMLFTKDAVKRLEIDGNGHCSLTLKDPDGRNLNKTLGLPVKTDQVDLYARV